MEIDICQPQQPYQQEFEKGEEEKEPTLKTKPWFAYLAARSLFKNSKSVVKVPKVPKITEKSILVVSQCPIASLNYYNLHSRMGKLGSIYNEDHLNNKENETFEWNESNGTLVEEIGVNPISDAVEEKEPEEGEEGEDTTETIRTEINTMQDAIKERLTLPRFNGMVEESRERLFGDVKDELLKKKPFSYLVKTVSFADSKIEIDEQEEIVYYEEVPDDSPEDTLKKSLVLISNKKKSIPATLPLFKEISSSSSSSPSLSHKYDSGGEKRLFTNREKRKREICDGVHNSRNNNTIENGLQTLLPSFELLAVVGEFDSEEDAKKFLYLVSHQSRGINPKIAQLHIWSQKFSKALYLNANVFLKKII